MNNNITEIIKKVRGYLESTTPIKGDCGLLCDSLCCKRQNSPECGSDEEYCSEKFGMWLFPGEDKLYKNNKNFKVIADKSGGNNSYPFLLCGYSGEKNDLYGLCKREERPLFCRFFPYFPAVENKSVKVIIHPTAYSVTKMCPIILNPQYKLKITSDFSRAVKRAAYIMMNNKELRRYLIETGEYLKSMTEFVDKILGG